MARGQKTFPKRLIEADPRYNSVVLEKFIHYIMQAGEKNTARSLVYEAMRLVEEKLKKPPMEVFAKALKNVAPQIEVKTRRVGGANYQVPVPVQGERKKFLSMKWIIGAARSEKGKGIPIKLAGEFIAAYNNEGGAVKKKQQVEKMAEANRAFAFLGRRR